MFEKTRSALNELWSLRDIYISHTRRQKSQPNVSTLTRTRPSVHKAGLGRLPHLFVKGLEQHGMDSIPASPLTYWGKLLNLSVPSPSAKWQNSMPLTELLWGQMSSCIQHAKASMWYAVGDHKYLCYSIIQCVPDSVGYVTIICTCTYVVLCIHTHWVYLSKHTHLSTQCVQYVHLD